MNPHYSAGPRVAYGKISAAANHYFAQQKHPKTGNAQLYCKAVVVLALFVASYVALLLCPPPYNALAWAIHGFATALVGFNIMHDGAHESFSQSRALNRLAAASFNMIGSNRHYWAQKHNRSHHSFTNLDQIDEDIHSFGLIRMSPHQPHFFFHRWQVIYVWLLYPFTSLFWFFVLDFKAFFSQKIAQRAFSKRLTVAQHLEFWLCKAGYLILYIALPWQFLSASEVLWGFFSLHLVLGFIFAVVFQMAHVMDKAEFIQANADGAMPDEWAIHQLRTTVNFAPNNALLTWLLGGLNYQTEHHLFPRISHIHYPALHQALAPTLAEIGHPVKVYPTLRAALAGHINHLRTLSYPPLAQAGQNS